MRTITLELLRHGPAHNQLLSPLTPYLALCENHGAVTLHVPFEHNQFLHRLRALAYKNSAESRIFQLTDTAKSLGDILALIPGLTAESSKDECKEEPLTHLRLIISASELALLPFELALSPNGLPGAGQHLLLQPQMPICLTREVRRVSGQPLKWPQQPRILFIAAAPPAVGAIPMESHLLALRRAISPWVNYYEDDAKRRTRVAEHLEFLPYASIEAIREKCATGKFTHIHLLAHGVERTEGYDKRFFIALHDTHNPEETEFVNGAQLATALRASKSPDSKGLASPVVVTLASCDSGNVGSVAGAGASIAHALHEAGIPMVVAGQFPLSFEGSVLLVECLYEGMLWGNDPRFLLYDMRRRLYAQFQNTHDWASLTAYVSLPSNFDAQIKGIQIAQATRSVNVAMTHADKATRRILESFVRPFVPMTEAEKETMLGNAEARIEEAKKRLKRLLDCIPEEKAKINARLASTEKRQAEVIFSSTKIDSANETEDSANEKRKKDARAWNKSVEMLRKARNYYWDSFLENKADSWVVTQYIALTIILKNLVPNPYLKEDELPAATGASPEESDSSEERRPERNLTSLWHLSRLLSLHELHGLDRDSTLWAHGNLLELYLMSQGLELGKEARFGEQKAQCIIDRDEAKRCVFEHANKMIDIAGRDAFEVYSTRRQISRYLTWFREISVLDPQMIELAEQVHKIFPPNTNENW